MLLLCDTVLRTLLCEEVAVRDTVLRTLLCDVWGCCCAIRCCGRCCVRMLLLCDTVLRTVLCEDGAVRDTVLRTLLCAADAAV